jgi:hypothetical protein
MVVILILIMWKGRAGETKKTLFVVFILILWKGRSGRIKGDFICRSYLNSVDWKEREKLRPLYLSFLF